MGWLMMDANTGCEGPLQFAHFKAMIMVMIMMVIVAIMMININEIGITDSR
jgi:hypothetical protein